MMLADGLRMLHGDYTVGWVTRVGARVRVKGRVGSAVPIWGHTKKVVLITGLKFLLHSSSLMFFFFFCSHWSLVDVPLIFFCPADHVPDWQPRILLGMVEARLVNVRKITTNNNVVLI